MLSQEVEVLSAGTSIRLARIRLEGWLSGQRPRTISDYVDRLFARTVQARDPYADAELSSLLIDRRGFLDLLEEEMRAGTVCTHLVDALRLAWVFRQNGLPRHEIELGLTPFVQRLEAAAEAWKEPECSEFYYWARRLGWTAYVPENEPTGELSALLRQCDYGATRLARSQVTLQRDPDPTTAMWLAGTLWAETALDPPSTVVQENLAARLIELQDADGGFPGDSRHRASCLALVALSLVQAVLPPSDRNLG